MHFRNLMQMIDELLAALAPEFPADDTGTEIIAYLSNCKLNVKRNSRCDANIPKRR